MASGAGAADRSAPCPSVVQLLRQPMNISDDEADDWRRADGAAPGSDDGRAPARTAAYDACRSLAV